MLKVLKVLSNGDGISGLLIITKSEGLWLDEPFLGENDPSFAYPRGYRVFGPFFSRSPSLHHIEGSPGHYILNHVCD